MHSNQRDIVGRYKNLRGQRADRGRRRLAGRVLNTKIKTAIMYILYKNIYLEPKIVICHILLYVILVCHILRCAHPMLIMWHDIRGIYI